MIDMTRRAAFGQIQSVEKIRVIGIEITAEPENGPFSTRQRVDQRLETGPECIERRGVWRICMSDHHVKKWNVFELIYHAIGAQNPSSGDAGTQCKS